MEINKKEVGKRIRELRISMDLSMEKFGKLIGDLPRSTVNNWERGINLPKQETLNRIAEVGNTTNEYLLYGDQENQYILDLLEKKAGKLDSEVQEVILSEIKDVKATGDNEMDRVLDFFAANLVPPSEKDQFSFQLIDETEHLYLGFTDYGKKPQLYLQHDSEGRVLHIIPFTFASFSMNRLLVYLANEESLPYFSDKIDKKILEEFVILYTVSSTDSETKLYPLSYDKTIKAYSFQEENVQKMDGRLYLPFIEEIEKEKLLNQKYREEN